MRSSQDNLTGDSYLTGTQVRFFDKNASWKDLLVKTIKSPSTLAKYAKFDDNMEAFINEKGLMKIGKVAPPTASSEREWVEVTINPYHLMTDLIEESDIIEDALVGVDTRVVETNFIHQMLNVKMNADLASALTSSTFTAKDVTAAKWTSSTGDPEDNILEVIENIEKNTGGKVRANTVAMGRKAFRAMINKTNLLRSDIKYTLGDRTKMVSTLKDIFGVERILILPDSYKSTKKGQSATMTSNWGSTVFVGYIETENPSKSIPSAVYGISVKRPGSNEFGIRVSSVDKRGGAMFDNGQSGVKTKLEIFTNFFVCSAKLGYRITNVY